MVGCCFTFHGIQDTARKRRKPSREPGAWAGTIIHRDGSRVMVLVSQMKWEKTKSWIGWLNEELEAGDDIDFKQLEKCQGFLYMLVGHINCLSLISAVCIKLLMVVGDIRIRMDGK